MRYQDPNNYYLIHTFYSNQIVIYKKVNGTYTAASQVTIPATLYPGMWYNVKVVLNGSIITVYWGGGLALSWSDPSPWLSGKVGFRQCAGRQVRWDNFLAWDASASPTVAAYDDYYPFGQQMDNRSFNSGFADGRYKYTEKERDAETGYDYFGARYYDARVGRFLAPDPHESSYPESSPFAYAVNNPMSVTDPTGMDSASQANVGVLAPSALNLVWERFVPKVLTGVPVVGFLFSMSTMFAGDVPPYLHQSEEAAEEKSASQEDAKTRAAKDEAEHYEKKFDQQAKKEQKAKAKIQSEGPDSAYDRVVREEKLSPEQAKQLSKEIHDIKRAEGRGGKGNLKYDRIKQIAKEIKK